MFDSLDELHKIMQQENISVNLDNYEIDEDHPNNDRELIDEFLLFTKQAQDLIAKMEANNAVMEEKV